MPRYDRGVAQRLASRKRKKRVAPARASTPIADGPKAAPATGAVVDEEAAVVAPIRQQTRPPIRITRAGAASAREAPRRTFASYAAEYSYVAQDLRRIVLVAGGLLVMLVVLSFFIQ